MYFLIVLALLSTFIYVNLIVSDAVNARINPYAAGSDENTAKIISKIKYALLVIMAFSWGAVMKFM